MKILIVDDEEAIREVASFYIKREGYEPTAVEDGAAALEAFRTTQFDLVILDIMMPERSGFEVCSAIRDLDDQVPIIILSAKSELIDKSLGFKLGADDYITKPFDPVELMLRVNSCLRRSKKNIQGTASEAIVIDDLIVNAAEHSVTVRGERVSLTAKEFSLLAHMAHYPNVVFSRTQLLHAVWGEDHVGDADIVTVFIRKLREKIEEDPAQPRHLLTEWGVGYRLV